jgi:hypothetical protein
MSNARNLLQLRRPSAETSALANDAGAIRHDLRALLLQVQCR